MKLFCDVILFQKMKSICFIYYGRKNEQKTLKTHQRLFTFVETCINDMANVKLCGL